MCQALAGVEPDMVVVSRFERSFQWPKHDRGGIRVRSHLGDLLGLQAAANVQR